jgi:hypothetical protein
MARLIGNQSKYLAKISTLEIFAMAIYGILLVFSIIVPLVKAGYELYKPGYLFGTLIVIAPVAWLAWHLFKKSEIASYAYAKGSRGEQNIITELAKSLSDDYVFFHHVVLDKNKGDIDLVVLGPTGLFIIEVKNYSGEINLVNDILVHDGKPFEKDIFWQTKGQARQLEQYLKSRLGITVFARKVIVFDNGATMKFGLKPIHDTYIIKKQWLKKLIEEVLPPYIFPVKCHVIQDEIHKAVLSYYKN